MIGAGKGIEERLGNPVSSDTVAQTAIATRYIVSILLLAAAPILHVIATWDLDGLITPLNHQIRLYSLPVVIIEVAVLIHALQSGWSPARQFSQLPATGKSLVAAFVLWGLLTSAMSDLYPLFSVVFFCRLVLHILLLGALLWVISNSSNFCSTRWFAIFAVAGGVYVGLLVIFCVMVPDPSRFLWVKSIPSATNVRQIGNVVGLMALFPTAMIVFAQSRKDIAAPFALLTLMLGFIFWTGTRGAVVGYATAIGASLIWLGSASVYRKAGLLMLSGTLAFICSHYIPKPASQFGMIRMMETVTSEGVATSGRMEMWRNAIDRIMSSPTMGYGTGAYKQLMAASNGYPFNHPHNSVLQFAFDWGIPGALLACALLGWLGIKIMIQSRANRKLGWFALLGYVCLLSISLVEGTLFHPLPIVIAIVLMAPLLAAKGTDVQPNGGLASA